MEKTAQILLSIPPMLISIVLHEFMHGYVADKLNDPTPRRAGRLTLNPIKHIDPFGTIILPMILLIMSKGQFAFGWAKPVPINPMMTLNPKRTMGLTALAGPLTNFVLAIICLIVLKITALMGSSTALSGIVRPVFLMFVGGLIINVALFVFNLIPIPPLDGGRVLVWLLPDEQAETVSKIEPYGMFIIFGLLALNPGHFLDKLIGFVLNMFTWFL